MSLSPRFHVVVTENIIKVDLEGHWNAVTDVAYLNELSLAMRSLRHRPWALIVDMRGWIVDDEMRDYKSKIVLHHDRRNQAAECWIVDDMTQGDHVVHFIKKAGVPFNRCMDIASANAWLSQFGFSL